MKNIYAKVFHKRDDKIHVGSQKQADGKHVHAVYGQENRNFLLNYLKYHTV